MSFFSNSASSLSFSDSLSFPENKDFVSSEELDKSLFFESKEYPQIKMTLKEAYDISKENIVFYGFVPVLNRYEIQFEYYDIRNFVKNSYLLIKEDMKNIFKSISKIFEANIFRHQFNTFCDNKDSIYNSLSVHNSQKVKETILKFKSEIYESMLKIGIKECVDTFENCFSYVKNVAEKEKYFINPDLKKYVDTEKKNISILNFRMKNFFILCKNDISDIPFQMFMKIHNYMFSNKKKNIEDLLLLMNAENQ
jgi:hypothetical protein